MPQMNAVQIRSPGGPVEAIKREIPVAGQSQIRIKVQACGICHSDVFVKEGHWPGLQYPRVTGHEGAGVVDEVGAAGPAWETGPPVGVGGQGGRAWVGMAAIVVSANPVVVAISWVADISK